MKKQIAKVLFINSFQKEIRSKTFWTLLISSILIMLGMRGLIKGLSLQLNSSTIDQFDFYFYFVIVNIWSGLMMMLLAMNCIKSDTRYGMSEQILAFPIRSEQYYFLRLAATTILSWFFFILLFSMMALFLIGTPNYPISFNALLGVIVFLFNIFAITTLGAFLSIYLGQISGFIVLLFTITVIAYVNRNLAQMDFFYVPGFIINWLLPHLGKISQISNGLITERKIPSDINLLIEIPHFLVTMPLLFFTTHHVFKKRGYK